MFTSSRYLVMSLDRSSLPSSLSISLSTSLLSDNMGSNDTGFTGHSSIATRRAMPESHNRRMHSPLSASSISLLLTSTEPRFRFSYSAFIRVVCASWDRVIHLPLSVSYSSVCFSLKSAYTFDFISNQYFLSIVVCVYELFVIIA